MNAKIVVDLGFGDAGKGITTDYLCRTSPNPIVVRFSGGHQAGHTVMIDGKKHIHSSYGAGTLRGVPSYFSEQTCFYLNNMHVEKMLLETKGVVPELYIHPLAMVTTPYDVAWNRVREKIQNHGSCGTGVGATMKRCIETPYKLYAKDLKYKGIFLERIKAVENYYLFLLRGDQVILNKWLEIVAQEMPTFEQLLDTQMFTVTDYNELFKYQTVIFEGSQGILLDMDHGIFPNVTYAHTTSKNAIEICQRLRLIPEMFYITRCYQTRHGHGWMSNQDPIELINNQEEINVHNEWQKDFKIGEFDVDLVNYAIETDMCYSGAQVSGRYLVWTCLDQRPEFEFPKNIKPVFNEWLFSYSPDSKDFKRRL